MDELDKIEGWVRKFIDFEIEGASLVELASAGFRDLVGDWMLSPSGWMLGTAAVLVWLLGFSWLALRLNQLGRWGWSLASFSLGYEGAWYFLIGMYIGSERTAQFILYVLPLFGWTFTAVTMMTALVFWQNGAKKVVYGLPRLLLGFAEKRGWLTFFLKGGYRIGDPRAYINKEGCETSLFKEIA